MDSRGCAQYKRIMSRTVTTGTAGTTADTALEGKVPGCRKRSSTSSVSKLLVLSRDPDAGLAQARALAAAGGHIMEDPPRKGQLSCSSVTLRMGVVCPEVKMTGDTVVTTLDRVRTRAGSHPLTSPERL